MNLKIVEANILDLRADAILVPIDGLIQGHRVNVDRQLGAIGHQLMRKYPDAELDEEIADQVAFPIPLGRAAVAELDDDELPYRWIVLLSMLPHLGQLDPYTLRKAARSAFFDALALCDRAGVRTVLAPLLKGGWRIRDGHALDLMFEVLGQQVRQGRSEALELRLCLLSDADSARRRAEALGLICAPQ